MENNSERLCLNLFACVLEDILASRGFRLTHLDDRTSIHTETVRRLQKAIHPPGNFSVLSPEGIDEITQVFALSQEEVLRLRAAILVTSVTRTLVQRIPLEDTLLAAQQLLPILVAMLQGQDGEYRGLAAVR